MPPPSAARSAIPAPSSRPVLAPSTSTHLGKRPSSSTDIDDPAHSRKTQSASSLKLQLSSLERENLRYKSNESKLHLQLEEQRIEIERLKEERYGLYEAKVDEVNRGEEKERRWGEERRRYADEVALLRQRNTALVNELEELRSQHTLLYGKHTSLSSSTSNEITLLQARIAEVEKERESLKGWERRARGLSIELEEERRRRIEGGEKESVPSKPDETLSNEVKRQSLNLSTIYRANETLKSELVELRSHRKTIESVERAHKETEQSLGEEIKVLQEQLERARRDMDSLTQTFPLADDTAQLTQLRTRISALSTLHTQATSELAQRECTIRDLRTRLADVAESSRATVSEISSRLRETERELRWAVEGRQSAERRETLIRQEVDTLRLSGAGGGVDAAEMDRLLQTYRDMVETMQRDSRLVEEKVAQGQGLVQAHELANAQERISQLESDVVEFDKTIEELTTANARLDAEVSSLMCRVASGEFNPLTERCLELRNNPEAKIQFIRKQELTALRQENNELLERLAELDGILSQQGMSGDVKEGMVPRSSYERLNKDQEDMGRAHEKRLTRLKEVFAAKTLEFLEAVFSVLGWRIKFEESGSDIRLTSMYAPKGKSGLTIKMTSREGHFGSMKMSGMMARSLEEARHFWVVERQSVPGFLAQVTIEMFEKTTMGRAAGYVGLE
ncbi:hypothetical protein L202_03401 [Cryptococcus amylolentus CBS 6039]|uniref:Spindle assembly checkpoint component MAD1 n=1 Tax=Cryptococcus amylolentus CBS 6039 TaxID=1295533 RepID=A0A1E3HSS3_9TREE|nr:hypothetical protein L202_03401 [Cryptococcus amylolentus CBS 6039]ODN79409.1 hypothetical protein L202_03401 [Cryptococcus amylolentus CBS 6039]